MICREPYAWISQQFRCAAHAYGRRSPDYGSSVVNIWNLCNFLEGISKPYSSFSKSQNMDFTFPIYHITEVEKIDWQILLMNTILLFSVNIYINKLHDTDILYFLKLIRESG